VVELRARDDHGDQLQLDIDQIIKERGDYKRIVLIGHSMGAVLGRRLFLLAAGTPPGFRCEKPLEAAARPWATLIDRHVTLAAFNRGWLASQRDGWRYSLLFNLMGLFAHLAKFRNFRSTVFDLRVGSPFMVQTRLHWLAYRRWQQALRSAPTSDKQAVQPASPAGDPLVVQIIGAADDLTSPLNQVDIAIDRVEHSVPPRDRRYLYLEMEKSTHKQTIDFTGDPEGPNRRELFIKALTKTPDELQKLEIASNPAQLVDDLPPIDQSVTDGVFVMHGIRDDGYWTSRLAKRVKERAPEACVLKSRTPTYGYFAMLPFLLPWIRQQKVEWFMDQYVGARAQFPKADISFVGHSNGTYLAARALKDYDDAKFKNVFFAGSVVQRNYPWQEFVDNGRVSKFHNVRASKDWVVALLPKSVEGLRFFDLGGAGFDGFDQAGSRPSITQARKFANGQHSAALVETQWDHIADFILDGKVPEESPNDDFVEGSPWLLRAVAATRLVLPLLAIVLLLGVPLLFVWPLLSTLAVNGVASPMLSTLIAHGLAWPQFGLTAPQAIGVMSGLAVYFAALKFFITRV
jgi:pimeloyl-ACP methyl ester carboxylesterase